MKPKPFSALNHFTVPVAIIFFPPRALCRSRMPGPIVAVFVVRSRSGTKRTPGTRPQAFKTCDAQQLRGGDYPSGTEFLVFCRSDRGQGPSTVTDARNCVGKITLLEVETANVSLSRPRR